MKRTIAGLMALGTVLALISAMIAVSRSDAVSGSKQKEAVRGLLDLRAWDFNSDGPAGLTGEWEFRWGELLGPEQFHGAGPRNRFIRVPGIWNGRIEKGQAIAGDGCATYGLHVMLPPGQKGCGNGAPGGHGP